MPTPTPTKIMREHSKERMPLRQFERCIAAPPAIDNPCIVRYDQIERLLAMSDHDLADIGLCRGDLEAYRDGRIKHLCRRARLR